MKKRIRSLVIAAIALVALVGLLIVLLLIPPAEDGSGQTGGSTTGNTAATMAPLIDKSNGSKTVIRSVTVQNADETYTVSADSAGVYRVEAYADLPVQTPMVDLLLGELDKITPDAQVASSVSDPSLYGFDKATKVSVTYADGTVYAFELGNDTPSGDGAYFCESGKDTVYRVSGSFALTIREPSVAYIGRKLVTTPIPRADDPNGAAQLMRLELTGKREPLTVRFMRDTDSEALTLLNTYLIEEPYLTSTDPNALSSWRSGFNNLTALTAVKAYPTAADLAEVGLDDPATEAVLVLGVYTYQTDSAGVTTTEVYDSATYNFSFSEKNADGNYYCVLDGVDVLYEVAASDAAFVDAAFEDIVYETLFLQNITNVSEVILSTPDKQSVFKLVHGEGRELTVTVDGQTVDSENLRNLYGLLVSVDRYLGISEADKDAFLVGFEQPSLTLTLTLANGSTETAALYCGSSRSLAVLDDGRYFLVRTTQVDTLLRQWDNLLAGKDVIEFF